MSDSEELFGFADSKLTQITPQELIEGQLTVADSWLVESGRVRNLQLHFNRFCYWSSSVISRNDYEIFCDTVRETLPHEGRWFPRIELIHNPQSSQSQLVLRLRPAPELIETMTLWTHPEPDPRSNPTIKGPDLSLGLQLRRAAQMHGADEAVLLNTDGYILEGALSSLVWFRGDVLCAPGDDLPWLPSITRQEVFAIAETMGIQTRYEKVKPADLVGLEIWSLSSLQGIRIVEQWVGLGGPVGAPRHLDSFNKRLRMLTANL